MSNADRRVIALGNLAGELKNSLEAAARTVGLELLLTREPARAFVELERDGALAVLVDMATLGAEQFCKRARGTERLRSVPVIGMSRHPNELGFARVFAWGADDLVPLGARLPLERRLLALRDTPLPDTTGFGQAVVAEATTQRRALVGRVLAQAGYDVKFAVDRGAVELYASQSETRLVVISAALGDPRRIIEAAAKAGALPTWIVTVEARSTQRLAAALAGLDRTAVTSTAGSPEDVLFLANELVFSKGARRREWRALYATPVAFRPEGSDADDYGFSYDASPSGLYVRSLLPCPTDGVEVELRLPNRDERVRLHGKVARRFAFGSGAIASAPPGFSVKLEGPADDLLRWTDACGELIAIASSESVPPRQRQPSQPVLASPGLGGKEVALAVPPATVSIESVVAPLPLALQTAIAEGSDVAELLEATLDEHTLTEVGTRPVTIDAETQGVREERPSEFAIDTKAALDSIQPLEPTISAPPVPVPAAPTAPSIPDPAPEPIPEAERVMLGHMKTMMGPAVQAPRPAPPADTKRGLGGTVVMDQDDEPPPPSSGRSTDWESDAKTAVRGSQPSIDATAAAAPAPNPPVPTGTLVIPDRATPALAKTQESVPAPKVESPKPAAVEPAPEPALVEAKADVKPPAPPANLGPAPTPPAALAQPSIKQTLPMGMPAQQVPTPAPLAAIDELPPLKDAIPIGRRPGRVDPMMARPALHGDEPPRKKGISRALLIVLLLAGALAAGMVLAVVTRHPPAGAPGTKAVAVPQQPPIATTPARAPTATAPAAKTPSKAGPAATTPLAPTSSAAAPSTAAPAPTPSAKATAPAPSATATATAAMAPPPTPAVDLTKLPPEKAYLIVHSSIATHVFVHGQDYGSTNQVLMTSCGIRFVRLGHALGDFVEPGQSRVIKCGKLTELSIEPGQ